MNILESFRVAMRGLASNKMRTALTMLGIIIGVGVVIIVVAIGQGATKQVTDTVNALGTNLLSIWPGQSRLRSSAVSKSASADDKNAPRRFRQPSKTGGRPPDRRELQADGGRGGPPGQIRRSDSSGRR